MNEETLINLLNKLNCMSEALFGAKAKVEGIEVSDEQDSVTFNVEIAGNYKEFVLTLPDGNLSKVEEWDK